MNNTFCSKCGNPLDNDSKYCSQCGSINQFNCLNGYNLMNNFNYNMLYREQLDLNWTTIILAISGVIMGILSIFFFWWISLTGLSLEIKIAREIKIKKQRGIIIAYMGISICGAVVIMYILSRLLS